jgi:basic membrane protein A and related proteins
VIGHGFQFQEPIIKVAADFPKVNFGIGTGFKLAPNVEVYDTKLEQGGYLMGIIAGALAKGPLTGVVGGVDVSEIHRGHAAYGMGAKSVNPNLKVVNNFVGDFNDLPKAKEAAVSLVKAGADVIWQSGDGIGLAVLGACKEQNIICMGNNTNQNQIAPNNTIASFVYDWNPVFKQMIQETADKKFGNKKDWIDFSNHGVSVAFNDALKSKLTPETLAALDKAQKGFEAGTLDLGDLDAVKLQQ